MESRLLRGVDAAVERALPADWPRVPHHRLPVRGDVRVRHCFRRRGAGHGHGSYLAIAILPPLGTRRTQPRDLAALVDHVLSRRAALSPPAVAEPSLLPPWRRRQRR